MSASVQLFNGAKVETMTGNYIAAGDINLVTTLSSTPGRIRERKRCPLSVLSFEGRKSSLKKMHQHYATNFKTQHIFVLYGLGGSGKSQLAYKFVEECQETNRFSDVFFVDATTKGTIQMDLEAITPTNVEPSIEATLRWLADQPEGNWLLVFNNADETNLNLGQFFPNSKSGNILITTRNQELLDLSTSSERVAEMEQEDAIELLVNLSKVDETNDNKDLATQIVKDLHCFALAISQAGAYIRRRSSLSKYRELYQRERDNLLNSHRVQSLDDYGYAVYATWTLSYAKLDDKAKLFLQVCSLLHHEGIREDIFEKAASSEAKLLDSGLRNQTRQLLEYLGRRGSTWSSWHFQEITNCLASHSLIDYDCQNGTYSIHPLVQHWNRTTIEVNGLVTERCVLTIICLSIRSGFSNEDYKYRRTLWKHINVSKTVHKPEDIDLNIASRIQLLYDEQGHWNKAEELQMVVMEKRKNLLGPDNPGTLASMDSLANTYRNQGRWKDAEVLQVEVVEKRKRLLGNNHPYTLASMNNLANTYGDQGRWRDAEGLQAEVTEKRKWLLGDDHPDTLMSMGNLAITYGGQCRWKDAEELQVKVMENRKLLLGDDHLDTLMSMGNLAITYGNQGRWDEAEALQVRVLETMRRLLGDRHPHTLLSMKNLSTTYRSQGRLGEAKD